MSRLTWLIAAFKFTILKGLHYVFFPWMNDMGVRVFTHFRSHKEFTEVLAMSLQARKEGKSYISIDKPKEDKPEDSSNIKHLHNHKRKSKKT